MGRYAELENYSLDASKKKEKIMNLPEYVTIEEVRKVCKEKIAPQAESVEKEGKFPRETLMLLASMDLFGLIIPEEYGGLGMGFLTWSVIAEEISKACATTGLSFGANILCIYPIMTFGNEEQKQEWLPRLCTGEILAGFGLTEPNAGSDAGNSKTNAVLDGDEWIINGRKIFITNGNEADYCVLIAATDKSQGHRGISAFIVDLDITIFKSIFNFSRSYINCTSVCSC